MTLVVENGTGLADAEVYSTPEACAAWLSRRGHTAFAAADALTQERALLKATEFVEQLAQNSVGGVRFRADQGLLFPRNGAYNRKGDLLDRTIPEPYKRGIYHLAEAEVQGKLDQPLVPQAETYKSASFDKVRVTYREPTRRPFQERHPEAWALISSVFGG